MQITPLVSWWSMTQKLPKILTNHQAEVGWTVQSSEGSQKLSLKHFRKRTTPTRLVRIIIVIIEKIIIHRTSVCVKHHINHFAHIISQWVEYILLLQQPEYVSLKLRNENGSIHLTRALYTMILRKWK